jgi:hypothetical protein
MFGILCKERAWPGPSRAAPAGRARARSPQPGESAPDEAAQLKIAECDAKLRQQRAALKAGADPVLVTGWINETQARRAAAEARLRKPTGRQRMTRDEITNLVTALGDAMQALRGADPTDRAEVYSRLGLALPPTGKAGSSRSPSGIVHICRKVSEGEFEHAFEGNFPFPGNHEVSIAGKIPRSSTTRPLEPAGRNRRDLHEHHPGSKLTEAQRHSTGRRSEKDRRSPGAGGSPRPAPG